MSNIQIITDSAADVPKEYLEKYQIKVVPLTIHFGEQEYKDTIDITTEEFYQKMESSKQLPSTNQVNPNQFVESFSASLEEGKIILYIGISLKLSGTTQSAQLARDILKSEDIHIFDTHSASLGEGLQVIRAAELVKAGKSVPEILEILEEYRKESFGYFILDSLNHLVKGGRLSKAQGVVGAVLNIKPILRFANTGEIGVAEKVRSRKKALQAIIAKAKNTGRDFSNLTVAVVHSNAQDNVNELTDLVEKELKPKRIIVGLVGATIATHAGPGGVGLFY